jgi:putative transposase
LNHVEGIAAIDMFVVASASFRLLYVMIILAHNRRNFVSTALTEHPTAAWLSRQITEAFPWDTAPCHLLRDRDGSYGSYFSRRVEAMGITEVITATITLAELLRRARDRLDSPRVFGSHRDPQPTPSAPRTVLLRRLLQHTRTHLSLDKDCPDPRPIQPRRIGRVVALPKVGGPHHRYERLAA